MRRRRFLHIATSAAAIAVPAMWPRGAHAAGWGELPTADPMYWPTSGVGRDFKILELHLSGGVSHYETFYVRTDLTGDARWFGKRAAIETIDWSACGVGRPTSATEVSGALAPNVALGPATKPLWPFLSQMRVVAMQHELFPHEVAIPLSISGLRPGNPKLAGLGAAIERRATSSRPPRAQPFSYVLMPSNLSIDEDSFQAFHATGLHGGRYRPLLIRTPTLAGSPSGRDESFLLSLDRSAELRANDALLRQMAAQYRDRLRHHALPTVPARSAEFAAYDAALESVLLSPQLRSTLDTAISPVINTTSCVDGGATPIGNMTISALRTAANLLSMSEADGGARYVGITDGGIRGTTGGGYDVHGGGEYPNMFTNLWNVLTELGALLHRPAVGAPADPGKIDLRDTVVLLNTEFGRNPVVSGGGRNHWPAGYVNVLIGGPVVTGVAGEVGTDGITVARTTAPALIPAAPADVHAAALMLAGIDPFDDANFGVGDVGAGTRSRGAGTEAGTAEAIRQHVLGF